jgi:DUF971 family protein
MHDPKPWPSEIRLSRTRDELTVRWDNGVDDRFSAEYLRISSPSAEVQGHSAAERKTVPGKAQVQILSIDPVGNYAVRLQFDDMHATGLYSWDWLWHLARERDTLWARYLDELAAKGLSREPSAGRVR